MKVFKVEADNYDRDEFISMVIVANSKERALEIVKEGHPWREYEDDPEWLKEGTDEFWEFRRNKKPLEYPEGALFWEFKEHQYPLTVNEISLREEQVIDVSYMDE